MTFGPQFALNLLGSARDTCMNPAHKLSGRKKGHCVKTVRPNKTEPIAGDKPQAMGTILIRFVVLLAIAVAVLALAWRR